MRRGGGAERGGAGALRALPRALPRAGRGAVSAAALTQRFAAAEASPRCERAVDVARVSPEKQAERTKYGLSGSVLRFVV